MAVGINREVESLAGPETVKIDLNHRSLLPGFIDAHCHPGYYDAVRRQIQCGPIEVGKLADLVVLSQNIIETPPDEILGIEVDMTMVDGEILYEKDRI